MAYNPPVPFPALLSNTVQVVPRETFRNDQAFDKRGKIVHSIFRKYNLPLIVALETFLLISEMVEGDYKSSERTKHFSKMTRGIPEPKL